jgi:hypothetical protein
MSFNINVKSPFSIDLLSPLLSNTAYYIGIPLAAYGITNLAIKHFLPMSYRDSRNDNKIDKNARAINVISILVVITTSCILVAIKLSHIFENGLRFK